MNLAGHGREGLVSVIMPVFNTRREFLEQAIDSVLGQTYTAWELLLVDDGSEVELSRFARADIAEKNSRIRYMEHPGHDNLGSSASRNLGIRAAEGEFIAFLDCDDVWERNKLAAQVSLMRQNTNVGMLYGNTCYWHSWTGDAEDHSRDYWPRLGLHAPCVIQPPELLTRSLQGRIAVPATCSVLVRRAMLPAGDGFCNAFRGLYDDQVFYAKLFATVPVLVSDQCWDRYRQHSQSMTYGDSRSKCHSRARRAYLEWLENYLVSYGVVHTPTWAALRQEKKALDGGLPAQYLRRCRRMFWRAMDEL